MSEKILHAVYVHKLAPNLKKSEEFYGRVELRDFLEQANHIWILRLNFEQWKIFKEKQKLGKRIWVEIKGKFAEYESDYP